MLQVRAQSMQHSCLMHQPIGEQYRTEPEALVHTAPSAVVLVIGSWASYVDRRVAPVDIISVWAIVSSP